MIKRITIIAAVLLVAFAGMSYAEGPEWTAADCLRYEPGLPVFRYFGHGMGAYPYRAQSPHGGMRVYVDNVPLLSTSPFGPDIDLITADRVASVSSGPFNALKIKTRSETEKETRTVTKFLLGTRRRFQFQALYEKPLSDRSGLVFSGSSSGSRGADDIEKNTFRSYNLTYTRLLANESRLAFRAGAYRDRDGLADLETTARMGERKNDNILFSLALEGFRVGDKGSLSPTLYWQTLNSRYDRDGSRRSLDNHNAGLAIDYSDSLGTLPFGLNLRHDIEAIESHIHDHSWYRRGSDLGGWITLPFSFAEMTFRAGYLHSSKYGGGMNVSAEMKSKAVGQLRLCASVERSELIPDTGVEFHTALAFTDSTHTADLAMGTEEIVAIGIRDEQGDAQYGVSLFASSTDTPIFRISSTRLTSIRVNSPWPTEAIMDKREFRGVMADGEYIRQGRVESRLFFDACYRDENSDNGNWPYPETEIEFGLDLSDSYFGGILGAELFFDGTLLSWEDGWSQPESGQLFLNTGLSLEVGTLTLFYRMENLTNEDPAFFGTFGWFGRNAVWGANWRFID